MSDKNGLKLVYSDEFEALVAEIKELKERVTELEHDKFHKSYADSKEFVGKWLEQKTKESSTITCNTSELF